MKRYVIKKDDEYYLWEGGYGNLQGAAVWSEGNGKDCLELGEKLVEVDVTIKLSQKEKDG